MSKALKRIEGNKYEPPANEFSRYAASLSALGVTNENITAEQSIKYFELFALMYARLGNSDLAAATNMLYAINIRIKDIKNKHL